VEPGAGSQEPGVRGKVFGDRSHVTCGGRGKKVRTLAGAFEPTYTTKETRVHATRVSPVAILLTRIQECGRGIPVLLRRRWTGSAGRSRACTQVHNRGGPAVLSTIRSGATRFECWWPLARGNPATSGSSRASAFGRARRRNRTRTACAENKAHACGDGRRKFLPVTHRAGSFSPRRVKGATSERPRGFVQRAVAIVSG
jgi:hypothetical protein